MLQLKVVLACIPFIVSCSSAIGQSKLSERPSERSLPRALLAAVKDFHVSIIGELREPVPVGLEQDWTKQSTLNEALSSLVKQCPDYTFFKKNGVVVFAEKSLLTRKSNPLNIRVPEFRIYNNLSDFKLDFPVIVSAALLKNRTQGAAVTGIGLPPALSPPLRTEVLRNQTALDILVHVGEEVGNLYSILIMPNKEPSKLDVPDERWLGWEIVGGEGVKSYQTYLYAR